MLYSLDEGRLQEAAIQGKKKQQMEEYTEVVSHCSYLV